MTFSFERKPEPIKNLGRSALREKAQRIKAELLTIEGAFTTGSDGKNILKNLDTLRKSPDARISELAKELITVRDKWKHSA